MPLSLGAYTFDTQHTAAEESWEEVGGRDERIVTISGAIVGETTLDAVEAKLDAILDAASDEDYSAALSLREGRQLFVRRQKFTRSVEATSLVGAFTLVLAARDPYEEAIDAVSVPWTVAASGATIGVASSGTAPAPLRVALTATDTIVDPAVSDGKRMILFAGTVEAGATLILDGIARAASIDGEDVTPYTVGNYPEAPPEGATLTYTDGAESTHSAEIALSFRDRWW